MPLTLIEKYISTTYSWNGTELEGSGQTCTRITADIPQDSTAKQRPYSAGYTIIKGLLLLILPPGFKCHPLYSDAIDHTVHYSTQSRVSLGDVRTLLKNKNDTASNTKTYRTIQYIGRLFTDKDLRYKDKKVLKTIERISSLMKIGPQHQNSPFIHYGIQLATPLYRLTQGMSTHIH